MIPNFFKPGGITLLTSLPLTLASQPGSVPPLLAPMRNLSWGSLNFLHTTDTHGWHGGHLQESQYTGDWGDYVSFASHLRARANADGLDLLLVDTGDRVEGNGLYDASNPQGKYTYEIFAQQSVDVICSGNHELYRVETAERERDVMVAGKFKESYIASNLDYLDPTTGERRPVAQRYRRFRTKNRGIDILAFGFLFDFTRAANNTIVQPVGETLQEQWFRDAITGTDKPDVFLVAGHVGVRMDEFRDIFTAIRKENWHSPIVFLGGHAHVRDAVRFDERAVALASGRYFETVGWLGVDGVEARNPGPARVSSTPAAAPESAPKITFSRRYIDNNLLNYYHHTGLNASTFPTPRGLATSVQIAAARAALDLDHVYGCAPRPLWMSRTPVNASDSIFRWLQAEVLPGIIHKDITKQGQGEEGPRLAILNTGCIRFDIFKGKFTRDTPYIVSPFINRLRVVRGVPWRISRNLLKVLNGQGQIFSTQTSKDGKGMDSKWMLAPEQRFREESTVVDTVPSSSGGPQQKPLSDSDDAKPALVQGYTTTDDLGPDGDDAEHAPINFYRVPNCIQAEIDFPESDDEVEELETVDIVYLDFIEPYVLLALRFLGGEYWEKDTEVYVDETFMDLMLGWIRENWLCSK